MKVLVKSFSILALFSALNADCLVDYKIMYALADCENHKNRDIGYPYLISFNNKKDAIRVKKKLKLNWLDSRSVDCRNLSTCKRNLKDINSMKITNLDLGAYQINQDIFSYKDKDNYFVLKQSYKNACDIVYKHYRETKEWTWETIARYHSKTPKYNKIYADNLKKNYLKILKKQRKKNEKSNNS